jgi:hypothetical protein
MDIAVSVREKNHITGREDQIRITLSEKVNTVLEKRRLDFEKFYYKGQPLSVYAAFDSLDSITDILMCYLYEGKTNSKLQQELKDHYDKFEIYFNTKIKSL